jgi:ABC-type thiamine transport system substrate-binding protein
MSSRKKGDAQYAKPELQVASANSVKVRVVCRIRPLLQREIDAQPENSVSPLKIIDANTIEVYNDKEEHAFIIDRVYGIDTSQLQVLTVTHLLTHSPNHLLTHSITHSCTKTHVLH